MLYAAYGSNLHPRRLTERTPSAEFLGTAEVPGWSLTFTKRGGDGSGKCNIVEADAEIHVAVYRLDPGEVAVLDAFEGAGYRRGSLQVPDFGRCFTYLGEADWIDETLKPFDWYRELVRLGALRHDFPGPYRALIEAVACRADGDAERRATHERLVRLIRDAA